MSLNTRISIRVIPNSSKTHIVGWHGDHLKVKLVAPAEKGKANVALVKSLSKMLDLPRTSITIQSGHTNQLKVLTIENIKSDALNLRINEYLNSHDER